MNTVQLLERLIGFPTVSKDSNLELIGFARQALEEAGAEVSLVHDSTGKKANLYATVGPKDKRGVLLSGHTDVVPVEGQDWTVPPFEATNKDDRIYGRGSADMKGFVASALRTALLAAKRDLATPLHLALSHDEEIGCVGVRSLIDMLATAPFLPAMCIVGEPTSMEVATGHKGKANAVAECVGCEAHSAYAPQAVNAIHLATDLVGAIRRLQSEIAEDGSRDDSYDIPYTTLHVGKIAGGVALNIVPKSCRVAFEVRNLAGDDPGALLERIREEATRIATAAKKTHPGSDILIEDAGGYPALETGVESPVVGLAEELARSAGRLKVSFGTEGGLFSQSLGIPTVVCGPGSMDQGHKPDEFVSLDQLERCDGMLDALVGRLEAGI